MPPPVAPRNRQRPTSCSFCRTRKLRCSQPRPCTNCTSRGRICDTEREDVPNRMVQPINGSQSSPTAMSVDSRPRTQQQGHAEQLQPQRRQQEQQFDDQANLVAEIQELKRRTHLLESRAVRQSTVSSRSSAVSGLFSPSSPSVLLAPSTPPAGLDQIEHVLAHLEHVSRGRSELPIPDDGNAASFVLRVEHVRNIPTTPTHVAQLGKPIRCIYLPRHAEALALVDLFISEIGYIQHVLHLPSLPDVVDVVYRQIDGQGSVKPGHVVLLLSIIAMVTHIWTYPSARNRSTTAAMLFASPLHAHAQTSMWLRATQVVLAAAQESSPLALETVEGVVTLAFLVSNLEGPSQRYRSLISMGLFFGRELGLHRIDQEPRREEADFANDPVRVEVARRAWWYLITTDWLLATRYGGPCEGIYQTHPRQMAVRKPRNLNDIDVAGDGPGIPLSEATDMSYFLQRVRLAEIARNTVDNGMPVVANGPGHYAHIAAIDFELDQMIRTMPPHFRLSQYPDRVQYPSLPGDDSSSRSPNLFVQAYMLNSVVHTQRCRLHLAFLATGPRDSPAYVSSRETCLGSARSILEAEYQLQKSSHSFLRIRLRLSAMLYGVFIASIVLLMDACLNRTVTLENEVMHGDLSQALRLIEEAKDHSLAAANLYESLVQILARYRGHERLQQTQRDKEMCGTSTLQQQGNSVRNSISSPTSTLETESNRTRADGNLIGTSGFAGVEPVQNSTVQDSVPPRDEVFTPDMESFNFEDGMQQWNDLFSDLEMSWYG